jgi:hypothetical protein
MVNRARNHGALLTLLVGRARVDEQRSTPPRGEGVLRREAHEAAAGLGE